MKIRLYKLGTIVCFLGDAKGFAILVNERHAKYVKLGELQDFYYYRYKEFWSDL